MSASAPARIGDKTRTIRETRGLSVPELGERSGCSEGLINAIETGSIALSIAPLVRIARALGVRLGTLMDGAEHQGPAVDRAHERLTVARYSDYRTKSDDSQIEYSGLALEKSDRHVDPFILRILPGANPTPSSHEGEEFLFVLTGEVEVSYGKERYVLAARDSIYFDAVVSHRVVALGQQPAELLTVIYGPV
jgi:transcriptional regulator with XRE-family HTH domain